MRGVVVGLGIAVFAVLAATPQILFARRMEQPWINPKGPYGLVALVEIMAAVCGLILALVSMLGLIF